MKKKVRNTQSLRHLLKRAAIEIGHYARGIRGAFFVGGKWKNRKAQIEYLRLCALRREIHGARG